MANKKFSEFELKTTTSNVSHIVGYNGAENVRITPANFVTGGGTGVFLPLAGGTMVGNTIHNDNVKSIYGTGSDLEIFHDGTHSRIKDVGSGNLTINATDFIVNNSADTKNMITATDGGATTLFCNAANRLATTSTGISITGGADTQAVITGTTTAARLDIKTDSQHRFLQTIESDGKFRLFNQTTASEQFSIASNNNATFGGFVGIGVSPTVALDVLGTNNLGSRARFTKSGQTLQFGAARDTSTVPYIGTETNHDFSFITNDSEKMRLDTSGNLSINTTSSNYRVGVNGDVGISNSNKLYIGGVGADSVIGSLGNVSGVFTLKSDGNRDISIGSDTEAIFIEGSNGDVGIGTSSPDKKMTIVDTSAGSVTYPLRLQNSGTTAGTNVGLIFTTKNSGGGSASSIIRSESEDTSGNNSLVFTTPSGGSSAEALRIDSSQNVRTYGKLGIRVDGDAIPWRGTAQIPAVINLSGNGALFTRPDQTYLSQNFYYDANDTGSVIDAGQGSIIQCNAGEILFSGTTTGASSNANISIQERMRLTNSGVLGIGTTGLFSFGSGSQSGTFIQQASYMGISIASGQTAALILRRLEDGTLQRFYNSNSVAGSITVAGSATAYNTSSDYRLKEDLQDFKGLDLVSKIPVYDYKWKSSNDRSYGVMAHQLQEVLPDAVTGEKDAEEMQGVDYSKIVPLLVKSIQELKAEIELLKNK